MRSVFDRLFRFISVIETIKIYGILAALLSLTASLVHAQDGNVRLFDEGWRFQRGGAQGAEQPGFPDTAWRKVDLPHDWSIEDLPGAGSPFDSTAVSQTAGGFTTGGTGWYRKSFQAPASGKGKRIIIQFDGIYMNAQIWINGKRAGKHPYGYTSCWFDITDRIRYDTPNVVAVKVRNEGENSRWYAGSGIYRHVWLKVLGPVHVAQWGVSIATRVVDAAGAKLELGTKVMNETTSPAGVTLLTRILDPAGHEVARVKNEQTVEAGKAFDFSQVIALKKPGLWSVESPVLYTAATEVYHGQQLTDSLRTPFGIRTIQVDAVNGFRLNGRSLKLKGGCVHHDNGPLGAKAYDRAEERKAELLKAAGYNAVRCAHNPPSPAFLSACDRLGMLVIDEAFDTWEDGKNPEDYHLYFNEWWQRDVESMVLRDRNHPSVIMWSTGNEIPHREKPEVAVVAKKLADYIRGLDPSRPVTCGVNGIAEDKDAFLATLDVAGYNYARDKYVPDHQRLPTRVMYGTESFPIEAFEYWTAVEDHPWVIGDFVWTAFDYIGEASIGWLGYMPSQRHYPWNLAYCGDIDICGWKRPQSYYRDALWKKDQLSLFVKPPQPSFPLNPDKVSWSRWEWYDALASWNWKGHENRPLEVTAYTSCEEVELFLNGRSLGRKPAGRATKFMAVWQAPYEAGTLKVNGYRNGKIVSSSVLRTAAEPVQIRLSADRTNIHAKGQDLSYVTVELTDANNVRHPNAEHPVHFSIDGPGIIAGVGNANPVSTESYQQPQRKAWQGRCLVIVRSGGEAGTITLKASSPGLKSATLTINAR
jgi:beta-galactosidase